MALLETVQDNFNDNAIDGTLWPNSFGNISEVGGRARIACDTGFNAYSTALAYTLQNSSVYLRAYPHAGGGATTEAWAQILIKSSTGGTDLGFELRMTSDELVCFSRTGYFDPGGVVVPYSSTDHAWLRVRETGGTVFWDTSPDGVDWTNRRAETSPSWVGDADLEFQLIAHRSDGADDFAEFDNVNVFGQTLALALAAEADTARPLTPAKTRALGVAAGTDAAQPLSRHKTFVLGEASETSAARPLGASKRLTLGIATESATARPLVGGKQLTLGTAAETTTARALVTVVQRPAEALTAGLSSPTLTAGISGPTLTTSVSGGG